MSIHEKDPNSFENQDTDDDGVVDTSELGNRPSGTRSFTAYERVHNMNTYSERTTSGGPYYSSLDEARRGLEAFRPTSLDNYSYRPSGLNNEPVIHTKSIAETEHYLATHHIDLCKNAKVVRKTSDKPVEYEQRVCLRYLQPPPLPKPGPIIIEELRRPRSPPPPLTIREQPAIVEQLPPLILRERPPQPPEIPATEIKYEILPCESAQQPSITIERYPPLQEKPRDIIIEKWLPYGPLPEREIIRKRRVCEPTLTRPTCTIIKYENLQSRFSRRFAVVDVYDADPNDYMARYGAGLLSSSELAEQARHAGIAEDITSPLSVTVNTPHALRKSLDYRQLKSSSCDCFSASGNGGTLENLVIRPHYFDGAKSNEFTTTITYEERSN